MEENESLYNELGLNSLRDVFFYGWRISYKMIFSNIRCTHACHLTQPEKLPRQIHFPYEKTLFQFSP